ncbi:D-tyrosyl-tRNA(Tyr) deacylase [Thiospirochaeta perfilievii]|uniref:D-aminoacyl-tRNA deacylase n=1 Tax=Thiospirochaeta perfilievii TaxID=252967 RepID=A0A5C1QFB3_9SPIO|nr:D-aminoacyl-tRNA deacylase [Thiospirochaeta perfilievii]QEN05810.1 D-tyrosyl-tRNA(Tyr) deacylase [Thiospirochaeta perfilievii]
MRAVIQRVRDASVRVDSEIQGQIDVGLLVYVGFDVDDDDKDLDWMIKKIPNLRVFNDIDDVMNLSSMDLGHDILVISQFTLLANCKKGRRPSYERAAKPNEARLMYENFISKLSQTGLNIQSGVFQADMKVQYLNDGPVTIILDSKEK